MAWLSAADIKEAFSTTVVERLSATSPGVYDDTIIDAKIANAESTVKGHYVQRYGTNGNTTTATDMQTVFALDITIYRLYLRTPHDMPDSIELAYRETMKSLRELVRGDISDPDISTALDAATVLTRALYNSQDDETQDEIDEYTEAPES